MILTKRCSFVGDDTLVASRRFQPVWLIAWDGACEACICAASAAWNSEVAAYWTLDGHLLHGWMAWLHEMMLRFPGLVFVELDLCIAWSIWWWQQMSLLNGLLWTLFGLLFGGPVC